VLIAAEMPEVESELLDEIEVRRRAEPLIVIELDGARKVAVNGLHVGVVIANEVKQSHEIAASLRSSQGLLSEAVPYTSPHRGPFLPAYRRPLFFLPDDGL